MSEKLMSFSEALNKSNGKKRLLIGNGFSQACRKNIFSYGSLFEKADFSKLSTSAKASFKSLDTTNFKSIAFVLKALTDHLGSAFSEMH